MSDEFWDSVAPLLADGTLEEGTIMGSGCVRARGEFVAMPHHDEDRWVDLLRESVTFVNA